MTLDLRPETKRLVHEELSSGHVHSFDELIVFAVHALREKYRLETSEVSEVKPRKSLYDLLTHPPFAGSELVIDRQKDDPRHIDL